MATNVQAQEPSSSEGDSLPHKQATSFSIIDAIIVLAMCVLLYVGASWQLFKTNTDAARYQCYAVSFWQGTSALNTLPARQCTFITHPSTDLSVVSQASLVGKMRQLGLPSGLIQFVSAQNPAHPFHALPNEYPALAMIPFSLGLVVPPLWYQVAFAVWMVLIAAILYFVLLRWCSRWAAIAYAFYIVVGGWATAAGRFDIIPSLLTLLAVICAERKRWGWTFSCLALATLFKIYPVMLLPPFFLALQMELKGNWYAWRRWKPLGIFVLICIVIMGISFLFSAVGTIAPLNYFGYRPVQAESFAASLLWFLNLLGINPSTYVYTFGSLNVNSAFSAPVSLLTTALLGIGLLYTYWLLWRSKINLATATLLSLLVLMVTSKVFSPQYLIWVVPLVAYIGGRNRWYLLVWGVIGLLTTWIYPYIYDMVHQIQAVPHLFLFYPVVTLRNLLLLSFVLFLLISATKRMRPDDNSHHPLTKYKEQAEGA
jgi:Glycosyltransferase family 87